MKKIEDDGHNCNFQFSLNFFFLLFLFINLCKRGYKIVMKIAYHRSVGSYYYKVFMF